MMLDIPAFVDETLEDGEKLLWHGQPSTDFLFVPFDIVLVPWTAFLTAWLVIVANLDGPAFLTWTAISFAVFLLMFPLVRFTYDLPKRRQTHYLVTDKRILISTNTIFDRRTVTIEFNSDFLMTPINSPLQTTTIYFGRPPWYSACCHAPNHPFSDMFEPPAFIFILDGPRVMKIINNAMRSCVDAR